MVIDSHMHINSAVLDNLQDYIDDINCNPNIESVINVGLDISTSEETIEISKVNSKFYSTVGIHPLFTPDLLDDVDIEKYISFLFELSNNDKVVAIGEIGLDTHKDNSLIQELYFIRQIRLANELRLPVIIHSSNSNKRIIEIFETVVRPLYGCVFHCFQPDMDDLKYLVSRGYYISFAGRITYKTAKKSIEIAKIVPNDLFLVETDSPYISPEPVRNEINKSRNIEYIIRKLAMVKGMSYEEIECITSENTKRLFKKMK